MVSGLLGSQAQLRTSANASEARRMRRTRTLESIIEGSRTGIPDWGREPLAIDFLQIPAHHESVPSDRSSVTSAAVFGHKAAPMKMSWHAEGGRLASEWVESEATSSYDPAWMQSSYPCQAISRRSSPNQSSSLSPFGSPRYHLEAAMMPDHCG